MPAPYQDTFSGANGSALGTIELGGVSWSVLTGTWTRQSGHAHTATAASSNPLAVIDVGWGDVDASVSVSGSGGGDALCFRVTDATNWLRARSNVVTNGYTYGPWVLIGHSQLQPGDDAYGHPGTYTTDTSMTVVYADNHTDDYIRSKTANLTSTVQVEKSVAGTVTTVGSVASSAAVTAIRVVATGSNIVLYLNGAATSSGTFIDGTFATATKHGIGRGVSSTDASALDNFALTPLNRVPNAPTLTFPVGGIQIDSTLTQRFAWTFSDPDPGDSQSKATLYYRLTSDTSWTSVAVVGPNTFNDFAGGTFAPGDYEWQAETYDAAGHLGARSGSSFFTVATPPAGPTFTNPPNGSTISDATAVFDWTTTAQDSYQIRKVADDGSGNPDAATVYFDTGEVVDSAARTITLDFPTNSRTEHVQIRVKVSGLWSDWTDSTHPVSYTPPAKPNLTVVADDSTASITVSVTQPTPSGDQPDVSSVDIYRRILDSTGTAVDGSAIRIATALAASVDWTDWTPASSQIYQYQAVAVAANSTSTASNWTPIDIPNGVAVYDTSLYDADSSLYN